MSFACDCSLFNSSSDDILVSDQSEFPSKIQKCTQKQKLQKALADAHQRQRMHLIRARGQGVLLAKPNMYAMLPRPAEFEQLTKTPIDKMR
jgi:hypothetical protein